MAYEGKKSLDVVSEQPGVKQEKVISEKAKDEPKESRHEHKKGTESRMKNEMAQYHDTGLGHPAHSYETYKRPRRDS